MADSPKPKGKTNGLTRKLGPLPVWAWAGIGLLAGWYLYRRYTGASGSSGAAVQSQQVAAATPDTSMGASPSAGSPAGNDQTTSDLISSLGGENASLISAFTQVNSDVAGLAASQIAYAQTNSSMGSFNTQTQPAAAPQPGGSNAPLIYYMAPDAVAPQANQPAPTQTTTKSSAASSGGGQPFGGVTGVKTLANGATLTTYASGRQVEKVQGKTAYVVRA
jgi:hypothetical protein